MAVRRTAKGSRAKAARASPTPISLALATTATSTQMSTQAVGAQVELEDAMNGLSLADLTLDVPLDNPKPDPKERKPEPFRFMDLPSELRIKIYGYHFASIGPVVDLEPGNYFRIHKKLCILRVCRQMYHEAAYAFYSSKTFRIFPTDGRYGRTKKGLLARMKPQSRARMTSLELRLGPGFSSPYRSWVVNSLLGLSDCVNVRRLSVYIEVDPSDKIFNGWRKSNGFYETFCQNLLDDVLKGLPNADTVQFDAHTPVRKGGDMARGLLAVTRANERRICWGPQRGWNDADDDEVPEEPALGPIDPLVGYATTPIVMAQEVAA